MPGCSLNGLWNWGRSDLRTRFSALLFLLTSGHVPTNRRMGTEVKFIELVSATKKGKKNNMKQKEMKVVPI